MWLVTSRCGLSPTHMLDLRGLVWKRMQIISLKIWVSYWLLCEIRYYTMCNMAPRKLCVWFVLAAHAVFLLDRAGLSPSHPCQFLPWIQGPHALPWTGQRFVRRVWFRQWVSCRLAEPPKGRGEHSGRHYTDLSGRSWGTFLSSQTAAES